MRLAGSLPREVIGRMQKERDQEGKVIASLRLLKQRADEWRAHHQAYFEKFDVLLDSALHGSCWLREESIAATVAEGIHYRDGKEFDVLVFTIMPNHVHVVFVSRADCPTYMVTQVLRKFKWNTALKANRLLGRTGAFWQSESYDHLIRDGAELARTIWYVLNNPVNAGLAETWQQWKWTYVKPGLL